VHAGPRHAVTRRAPTEDGAWGGTGFSYDMIPQE